MDKRVKPRISVRIRNNSEALSETNDPPKKRGRPPKSKSLSFDQNQVQVQVQVQNQNQNHGQVKNNQTKSVQLPKLPTGRVFSVSETSRTFHNGLHKNIVCLHLSSNDIKELELRIKQNTPMYDIKQKINQEPTFLDSGTLSNNLELIPDKSKSDVSVKLGAMANLVKSIEKKPERKRDKQDRNLLINAGIKRTVSTAIHITGDSWPSTSPYACMNDCHTFDTTPVGIPYNIINNKIYCYGNFCSYNCAKRYLCPMTDDEDDMASMQACNDLYVGDEHGDKLQLLELLYHMETNAPIDESIKKAPKRLVLKKFGGTLTIEEYRASFHSNKSFHIFKMPIVSMGYQIEECVDTNGKRTIKNMLLDTEKLERARQELLKVKDSIRKELSYVSQS